MARYIANAHFGTQADRFTDSSSMSIFGGKADVNSRILRKNAGQLSARSGHNTRPCKDRLAAQSRLLSLILKAIDSTKERL